MNRYKNYIGYSDIINQFSEKAVQSRYARLFEECISFFTELNLNDNLTVDEAMLGHVVLDYYADISRLKEFHHIERVNEIKITAYLYYWFLRRKPIQVTNNSSDNNENNRIEKLSFPNELFVYSQLVNFLQKDLPEEVIKSSHFSAFLNSLFYYLKYRLYDAQTLEMLLISFLAGKESVGGNVSLAYKIITP